MPSLVNGVDGSEQSSSSKEKPEGPKGMAPVDDPPPSAVLIDPLGALASAAIAAEASEVSEASKEEVEGDEAAPKPTVTPPDSSDSKELLTLKVAIFQPWQYNWLCRQRAWKLPSPLSWSLFLFQYRRT